MTTATMSALERYKARKAGQQPTMNPPEAEKQLAGPTAQETASAPVSASTPATAQPAQNAPQAASQPAPTSSAPAEPPAVSNIAAPAAAESAPKLDGRTKEGRAARAAAKGATQSAPPPVEAVDVHLTEISLQEFSTEELVVGLNARGYDVQLTRRA